MMKVPDADLWFDDLRGSRPSSGIDRHDCWARDIGLNDDEKILREIDLDIVSASSLDMVKRIDDWVDFAMTGLLNEEKLVEEEEEVIVKEEIHVEASLGSVKTKLSIEDDVSDLLPVPVPVYLSQIFDCKYKLLLDDHVRLDCTYWRR